jgi:hypothetical protein
MSEAVASRFYPVGSPLYPVGSRLYPVGSRLRSCLKQPFGCSP